MTFALALLGTALADPCGMVPPAWIPANANPIQRIGDQQTYVFFADGMETIAIRPGFTGSADEFGMLVPMPAAPALRKISDDTFNHLAAAVDAPEVQVNIYDPRRQYSRAPRAESMPSMPMEAPAAQAGLSFDDVRVVNQEAMGMYEVAVLEAGSPKALERWMTERDYRYPKGMDNVVHDYVDSGWLFVAIKARVGTASGVAPQPGMRGVNGRLPAGAQFNGHVQGMAFRFEIDEPVVPMRLSTFNGDSAMNRVYMLADRPVRIVERDTSLVRRQVDGKQLYANVAKPLPVRYINGTERDVHPDNRKQIEDARDPRPYSGAARDLMAGDMLALATGELSLPFEKTEKELLNINHALGLKGAGVDKLVEDSLAEARDEQLGDAVADLADMTLTVMDGDFGKDWLSANNLEFAGWQMPDDRNTRNHWTRAPSGPVMSVPRNGSSGWVPW